MDKGFNDSFQCRRLVIYANLISCCEIIALLDCLDSTIGRSSLSVYQSETSARWK